MSSVISNDINETEEGNGLLTVNMTGGPEDARTKSCMTNYINVHLQPFINRIKKLSLTVAPQINSLISGKESMADAAEEHGRSVALSISVKNSSAFATADDFLNPAVINGTGVAEFIGGKSYLSVDTPYSKTLTHRYLNKPWMAGRLGALKRKFKENRHKKVKLEQSLLQTINAEHKVDDAIERLQKEDVARRRIIKEDHRHKMEAICAQSELPSQKAGIALEIDSYETKLGELMMAQQIRVSKIIMDKIRTVGKKTDIIKSEINDCNYYQSMMMSEVMTLKGIIDSSSNSAEEKRKLLEIIENNDNVWIKCEKSTNFERSPAEFKKRTQVTQMEQKFIDRNRRSEGRSLLTQDEINDPMHIPVEDIKRVIDASPLTEEGVSAVRSDVLESEKTIDWEDDDAMRTEGAISREEVVRAGTESADSLVPPSDHPSTSSVNQRLLSSFIERADADMEQIKRSEVEINESDEKNADENEEGMTNDLGERIEIAAQQIKESEGEVSDKDEEMIIQDKETQFSTER